MNRRNTVLALLALAITPLGVNAQQPKKVARIAILLSGTLRTERETAEVPRSALRELGYIDGQNVAIDVYEISGQFDRLPTLMKEILRTEPKVIVAAGSQAISAARDATKSVAIVAISVGDPVEQGFARSLSAPGGNITGNALIQEVSDEKSLQFVKELVPRASRIAVLINLSHPIALRTRNRFEASAAKLGFTTVFLDAPTSQEIPKALGGLAKARLDALIIANDTLFLANRKPILDAATLHRLPTVYPNPMYVTEGGLLSYTYDRQRLLVNVASFVDRILKGRNPANMPFEQPTHYVLDLNLKTAKAIGLTIPQSILLRADRVIE